MSPARVRLAGNHGELGCLPQGKTVLSLPSKVSSGHPGERQGQNQDPQDRLFLPKGKRVHAQGFCLAGVLVVPTSLC